MRAVSLVYILLYASLLGDCWAAKANLRQPFALVHPVTDHTQLELDEEGLSVLQRIPGPVAPVVVIGPYRSGKSFLLNQLLGVSCDEGFGVGHTRVTQTKGVWMWGEPVPVISGGRTVNLLFFDTEGFESTGKADVYDDRVFALSALLSAVLVYNLPEAIRESDLEKLSFAVELAKAFYDTDTEGQKAAAASGSATLPIRPGHMVWLIQRDFLQGKTLQDTLAEALAPVPNPHHDAGITQLNRIRASLGHLARNSSAVGLPQPHLDRTALCTLGDEALAPSYREKREALRQLIRDVAQPKVVQGAELDGAGLASLVRRVVAALNAREIPTAGSLVEYFNRELVGTCRDSFVASLERVALPVNESALLSAAQHAEQEALSRFERQRFGTAVDSLRQALAAAIDKELTARKAANLYESSRVCEKAEMACEEVLEREARQRLPSQGRFVAQFDKCRRKFQRQCVGPALGSNQERLDRAWRREEARFSSDYNARLHNGLTVAALLAVLVFRFVIKQHAAETAGWLAFVFLQIYPRTFLGEESMYDKSWWRWLVRIWEALVYNPILDLGFWGPPLTIAALLAYLSRRWYWHRLRAWLASRLLASRGRGGGGGVLGGLWRLGWPPPRSKARLDRDLDV
ncbi:hypothetical protein N2152v2_001672 [Parachlorella kessleri]